MPKNTRVAGHKLRSEGAAFTPNPNGRRFNAVRVSSDTVGGEGSAWCSCGLLSPVYPSGAARKSWHAGHKAEKLAEQLTEPPVTDAAETSDYSELAATITEIGKNPLRTGPIGERKILIAKAGSALTEQAATIVKLTAELAALRLAPAASEEISTVIDQVVFSEGHGDRQMWQSIRKSQGEKIGTMPETPAFMAGYRSALERMLTSVTPKPSYPSQSAEPAIRLVELITAGAIAAR